ncbi:MAG: hypothetical protein ACD_61C00251G0002 [uncultured bacterium]|nr:MAG: hypothetical protein ACD_61C00251G0002 [uncultured bacterium]
MSRTEQSSVSITLAEKNPFDLTMRDNDGSHRLSIEEPVGFGQGASEESQDLMRSMMAAHLLAPVMPEKIFTNFDFHFPELLSALYEYYGKRKPKILRLDERVRPEIRNPEVVQRKFGQATSHSGGLDSVYRIVKLLDQDEIPLAVHLKNLNAKGNYREAIASEEQCRDWKVPYLSVRLRNSSGNTGFDTMRTRDLLLALTVAVAAAPNNIKKVLIEGGMGTDTDKYQFSEQVDVWKWFNKLLKETGMDVEVEGVDPGDIETIGEIIGLEKKLGISILPMVQNCFSASFQVGHNRRKWERETPTIAEQSSYHWCGSCLKCRRMTLGRLAYGDPRFKNVSVKEVAYFVRDTNDWLKKYPNNADLVTESFLTHLASLGV